MAAASAAGAVVFCSFHSSDGKSHEVSSSGRAYLHDFSRYGIHRSESRRHLSCRTCLGPYRAEAGQPAHDVALARWGCLADSLSGRRDCSSLPRLRSSAGLNVHHFLTKRGWSEGAAHSKMPVRLTSEQGHRATNVFEVKDPRKRGCPRAGKADLAQAWEVLRQDVLYLDWKARQDVYAIKVAHDRVVEVLNPLAREQKSVGTLRQQLAQLQEDLARAHDRVHFSEARVSHSLKRLAEMETALKGTHSHAETPIEGKSVEQQIRADNVAETLIKNDGNAELPGAFYEPSSSTGGRYSPKKLNVSGRIDSYPTYLKNFWYPVAFTKDMGVDTLIPIESFEEPWVLFRGKDGRPGCVRDECAHRACPLSLGTVMDGRIQCPYHGWEYSTSGECKKMPSVRPTKASVRALPCIERDGMVWIWPGDEIPETQLPSLNPPANFTVHAEIVLEMPVEHGLLMENLLDLAHAPFTHTSTFAKGWPVPNFVRFKTPSTSLSGNWDPYPIDMAFQPPCMVLSTIGLVKPGQLDGASASACPKHLHQLHVCMPSTRGKTRLLYRMALDFASWAKHVPFIDKLWSYLANQVLNEDLRLVEGQQKRMERGANVWQTPVTYDKLGVRYRQWRIGVEAGIRKSSGP